jgi:hypothetical protein
VVARDRCRAFPGCDRPAKLVHLPPHRLLGRRRAHVPGQPGPALWAPSHRHPPRRVGGAARRGRAARVHPTAVDRPGPNTPPQPLHSAATRPAQRPTTPRLHPWRLGERRGGAGEDPPTRARSGLLDVRGLRRRLAGGAFRTGVAIATLVSLAVGGGRRGPRRRWWGGPPPPGVACRLALALPR